MSYSKPRIRPIPIDQICQYGSDEYPCTNEGRYYIKSSKKWCCEDWVARCPGEKARLNMRRKIRKAKEKKLKITHPVFDLEHVRVLYPDVYDFDVIDGTIRFNHETKMVEARCTYHDCKQVWYHVPRLHLGLRQWALSETGQGGSFDGYRFYCSKDCRKNCFAYGKSGVEILRDIEAAKMIDWDVEEEWYGGNATPGQRILWRETCLERDEWACQRCGADAEHVHHIFPVKTHPESEVDPINGISVCKHCHYTYFHQKGTVCAMNKLAGKECYAIVNGEKKKLSRGNTIYIPSPGILTW